MSDFLFLGARKHSSRSSRTPALWTRRRHGARRFTTPMARRKVFRNRSRRPLTCVGRSGVSIIEALYLSRAPIISHRVAAASTTIDRILLVGLASDSLCSTFTSLISGPSYALPYGTHAFTHQVSAQSYPESDIGPLSCVLYVLINCPSPPLSVLFFSALLRVSHSFQCH